MPNIAVVLKEEIGRLSRKEIRHQTQVLQKASAQHRRDIAALKRQVTALGRKVALLEKQTFKNIPATVSDKDAESLRFTAKGLISHRKRIGLSAADYAELVGVTGQTIFSWEQGHSRPRKRQLAALAAIRGMGKREADARLAKKHVRTKKR